MPCIPGPGGGATRPDRGHPSRRPHHATAADSLASPLPRPLTVGVMITRPSPGGGGMTRGTLANYWSHKGAV